MIRLAVVGLGKMGLSHLSIVRPHPDVDLVGICDSTGYLLDVLGKYTGLTAYDDYDTLLSDAAPDAVIIATPTHMHASMVRRALERGVHVFCEKPFVLDPDEGEALADLAAERGLVTQVGYHNHFVGSFHEVKRLVDGGAIGTVIGGLAEAYGPVVLKPAGRTWRSSLSTGGGALYDYAAHPLDLLMWYLGEPEQVVGRTTSAFSREIDDTVAATLHYPGASVQLNVNWSDESQRKMATKITLWGTQGRVYADRQELQLYLRDQATPPDGYRTGWNVRYTTELTPAPYFYVRGEEYSEQLDEFVRRVSNGDVEGANDFRSALRTDRVIAAIRASNSAAGTALQTNRAALGQTTTTDPGPVQAALERAVATGCDLGRQATTSAKQLVKRWRSS